jgi:uncharacterized membrane protein
MPRIENVVEVNVSANDAFAQWTRYEDYPKFMENVLEVNVDTPNHLHWRAMREGREVEWHSELVSQEDVHKISWRDTDGPNNTGMVQVHAVDDSHSRVQLIINSTSNIAPDQAGDAEIRMIQRVEEDLARFKALVEHPESVPFDSQAPGKTGVESSASLIAGQNDLLTNTPGSPTVPQWPESANSTADGQDNRLGIKSSGD